MYVFFRSVLILLFMSISVPDSLAQAASPTTNDKSKATITDEQMEEIRKEWEKMFPADQPGEEDLYQAERLLITATGSLKPLRLAPSVASVITADDIEAMGAATLDDALESASGLHVMPDGFYYLTPMWVIRGIRMSLNPQVLMLINNVPLKNRYPGTRGAAFRMPAQMISRIEVVRGPGSAVHGADAFSGVINVITKDGQEIDGSKIGLRAGSFDTYFGWVQHGGNYNGWDVAFNIDGSKMNNDPDQIIDEDRLGSGFPSLTPTAFHAWHEMVNLNLGLRKGNWQAHLYGQVQDDAPGPGAIQTINHDINIDTRTLLVDLTYKKDNLLEDLDFSTQLYSSYFKDDMAGQLFPKQHPVFGDFLAHPLNTVKESGIETTFFYKGIADHIFRLGAGAVAVDLNTGQYKNWGPGIAVQGGPMVYIGGTPYAALDPNNRHFWYTMIQDEWAFARNWELTAGIRYDNYSDFGHTVNPRAALVWECRYDLTAKLLYGQAFRAPSFGELYVKNNPVAMGNADLEPEEIETFEIALDYQPTGGLHAVLSLFNYRIEQLVDYVAIGGGAYQADNYGIQEGRGFEFELDWKPVDNFRLKSNFAFQRSRNKTLHALTWDSPEKQFYLNPHWTFMPNWSVDGQLYWIADRHRHPNDPRDEIDDYTKVNFNLRRKNIVKNCDLALGVYNLFNSTIKEPSPYDATAGAKGAHIPNDYPLDGRSLWVELGYKF